MIWSPAPTSSPANGPALHTRARADSGGSGVESAGISDVCSVKNPGNGLTAKAARHGTERCGSRGRDHQDFLEPRNLAPAASFRRRWSDAPQVDIINDTMAGAVAGPRSGRPTDQVGPGMPRRWYPWGSGRRHAPAGDGARTAPRVVSLAQNKPHHNVVFSYRTASDESLAMAGALRRRAPDGRTRRSRVVPLEQLLAIHQAASITDLDPDRPLVVAWMAAVGIYGSSIPLARAPVKSLRMAVALSPATSSDGHRRAEQSDGARSGCWGPCARARKRGLCLAYPAIR